MRAVLATSNAGKAREVAAILNGSGLDVDLVPMFLGHEETGRDYHENVRLKASAAMRLCGVPILAEDAGLEVDMLGGAPGPHSARFAGPGADDTQNIGKLLRLLAGVPESRRAARYRAVVMLLLPSGEEVVGEGVLDGRVGQMPRGTNGFGYDPVFFPAGETRTVGEMNQREKSMISHRARALRQLVVTARRRGML